jgi:glycosyltransferase involved in cell wall biosynthesis
MQKISVVIPTFNSVKTLGEQLAALARQDGASRVGVVISDNGSTDDTQALARTFMPQAAGAHRGGFIGRQGRRTCPQCRSGGG